MKHHVTDEHLTLLFDHLVAHPEGSTAKEIRVALSLSKRYAEAVIQTFRDVFADDTINLVATPQGFGEPWIYSLTGNLETAAPWALNRIADAETRLHTMESVLRSIETAVDGRSIPGRKARIMRRAITRAREDLAELAGP